MPYIIQDIQSILNNTTYSFEEKSTLLINLLLKPENKSAGLIFLINKNIQALQKQLFLDFIVHGNPESVQRLIQIWEEVPLTRTVSIEWKKKSLDFLNACLAPDISIKDYRIEIFAIQQQLEKLKKEL